MRAPIPTLFEFSNIPHEFETLLSSLKQRSAQESATQPKFSLLRM